MSTTENQYSTAPDGSVLCHECGAVLVNVKNILRHLDSDACRARHAAMSGRVIVEYSKTCHGTDWEALVGTPVADLLPALQEKKESFADSLRPHEPEEEELEQDPFPERGSYEELEAVVPEPTVAKLEDMGETTFVALTAADVKRAERLDLPIEYLPRHDELAALPDSPVEKVVHHSEVSGAPLGTTKESGAPLSVPATSKLIAKPRRWKGNLPQACAWLAQQLDIPPADLLTLGQRQYRPVGARGLWAALGNKQGREAVTAKLTEIMPQVVAYYNAATIETRCDGGTPRPQYYPRWVAWTCPECGDGVKSNDTGPLVTLRWCPTCQDMRWADARVMPRKEILDVSHSEPETRCDGGTIRARWVEYSCSVCGKTSERHDSRPAAAPRTCHQCHEKAEREESESAGKQDWRWIEITCPFCGGTESYHDDLSLTSLRWCDLCKAHVRTKAREMTKAEVTTATCGPETRCDGGQTLEERVESTLKEIQRKARDGDHGSWPQTWFADVPAARDVAIMLEAESGGEGGTASVQVIVPDATRVMEGETYLLGRWFQLRQDGSVHGWPAAFDLEGECPPTSTLLHKWADHVVEATA